MANATDRKKSRFVQAFSSLWRDVQRPAARALFRRWSPFIQRGREVLRSSLSLAHTLQIIPADQD